MTDIASSSVVCRSRLCLWKYEYLIIFFTLIESGWWKNAHCRGSWWYAFAIYVFIFAASSCECNALHIRNKCETLCAVMRDGLAQECSEKRPFFKFFATSENIYHTYFDYITQSSFLSEKSPPFTIFWHTPHMIKSCSISVFLADRPYLVTFLKRWKRIEVKEKSDPDKNLGPSSTSLSSSSLSHSQ